MKLIKTKFKGLCEEMNETFFATENQQATLEMSREV